MGNQTDTQLGPGHAASHSVTHNAMMLIIWVLVHWRLVMRGVGLLLLLLAVRSGLRALRCVLLVARVLRYILVLTFRACRWILVTACTRSRRIRFPAHLQDLDS